MVCSVVSALGYSDDQEDLAQTLLTFTEIVFRCLRPDGDRVYGGQHADAYSRTWSLDRSLPCSIHPDLLPLDPVPDVRADANRPAATVRFDERGRPSTSWRRS